MKYFVSHSYKDREWAASLVSVLQKLDKSITQKDIFFSSTPETGSDIKKSLLPNIDCNMNDSEIIILVITENYLRSKYCYYELNIASYLKRSGKTVILLVQHDEIYERIKPIFPDDLYVSAQNPLAANTFMQNIGFTVNSENLYLQIKEFFLSMNLSEMPFGYPFVGMSVNDYENNVDFVERNHLQKMTFGYPSNPEKMVEHLKGAKEIIFVSTTGSGFLKTYKKLLSESVANGVDISVVVADYNSQFCRDVGEFEVFDKTTQSVLADKNCSRIASEFDSTVQYLNEIYAEAEKISNENIGTVKCCCGYTLIRQTSFVIRYDDSSAWGWITCTMPPERSADKTPSIIVSGSLLSDKFVQVIWKYCKNLTEFAMQRGDFFEIDGKTEVIPFSQRLRKDSKDNDINLIFNSSKQYWTDKYAIAKDNMADRAEVYDGILIEVAAQHPLFRKSEPNAEFKQRLDKAVELYNSFKAKDVPVSIYLPGSRHKYKGIADNISLSQAAVNYLLSQGIPKDALLGDEYNLLYKGDDGVYNSADECYVASKIFFDGEYAKLICVCSPNQIMRKNMFYIEFGCLPICYGVTVENMYHSNVVNEIFDSLNTVLYFDHSWQDSESELYKYFRNERKP